MSIIEDDWLSVLNGRHISWGQKQTRQEEGGMIYSVFNRKMILILTNRDV